LKAALRATFKSLSVEALKPLAQAALAPKVLEL
jgi:hypothetical protein